jgi:hypothetical protein
VMKKRSQMVTSAAQIEYSAKEVSGLGVESGLMIMEKNYHKLQK